MSNNVYEAPQVWGSDHEANLEPGTFDPTPRRCEASAGLRWIVDGWRTFLQAPGTWLLLVTVWIGGAMLLQLIPLLGAIAENLLVPVALGGIMIGCHALAQGHRLRVGHILSGFSQNGGQLALIGLLNLTAVFLFVIVGVALLAVVGGLELSNGDGEPPFASIALVGLVIAALAVPLSMANWFATPLVALNRQSALRAFQTSFVACLYNLAPFLVFGGVLMLAMIVGVGAVIALVAVSAASSGSGLADDPALGGGAIVSAVLLGGLAALSSMPVMLGATYAAYRDIFLRS